MLHMVLVLLHNSSLNHEACGPKDKDHVGGGLDILQLFYRLILGHHIVNLNLEVHKLVEGEFIG